MSLMSTSLSISRSCGLRTARVVRLTSCSPCMECSVTLNTTKVTIPKGEKLIVTTELTQIENKLEPHKDPKQTNYDLIIDFLISLI